jgi:hypothetical protein
MAAPFHTYTGLRCCGEEKGHFIRLHQGQRHKAANVKQQSKKISARRFTKAKLKR